MGEVAMAGDFSVHFLESQVAGMVSVIIPVVLFGQELVDLTERCVDSVRSVTGYSKLEIILVDNGSPLPVSPFLVDNVDLILRQEENLGYAGGINLGFSKARGEWLVAMNNDLVVVPGWLGAMHMCWASHDERASVGAISAHQASRDPERRHRCDDVTRFPEAMFGALWITHRDVIEDVGGLDEGFIHGMWEDRDMWMRLVSRGYRLYKAGWCQHLGNRTWARLSDKNASWLANKERYERRWKRKQG